MLVQIPINEIPKNYVENPNINIVRVKSLSGISKIDPYFVLQSNLILRYHAILMFGQNNDEYPAVIKFNNKLSLIEKINDLLIISSSVFEEVRLLVKENNIIVGIHVKKLFNETKEAIKRMISQNEIDDFLKKIISKEPLNNLENVNVTAYQFQVDLNRHIFSYSNIITNKFLMFLIRETIINDGIYGVILSNWDTSEIMDESFFENIACVFRKVYLIGMGIPWKSTYLVLSEPIEELLNDTWLLK